MDFKDFFKMAQSGELTKIVQVIGEVSKIDVGAATKTAIEAYKVSVQGQHMVDNVGQQLGLALKYPELVKTAKYEFNNMAQLTHISATVQHDSKIDLRKLPRKIGDYDFKVKRLAKPKAP